MKLQNTLSIPVAADEAWRVLLDIERVAPCVPGATLTSREGDTYQGRIKVKLGPVGLTYTGTVKFLSRNETDRTVVLEAGGRETRGNGTAKALVTCRLVGSGENSTDVFVETDLAITGKPAQFGRGTLAEVAGTLIDRFAKNLAGELATIPPVAGDPPADAPAEAGGTGPAAPSGRSEPPAAVPPRTAEPIDLIDAAGASVLKRLAPPATALAALLLLVLVLRGRRRTDR
ncbi:SRPBCC domain-containing protein [Streptomyces sp. NPDC002680]|uniref:SRPBCC family protein n=1 Tax=Streptomyces sp. NPDC002680 TaxID=3364659 RepID=UPI003694867F